MFCSLNKFRILWIGFGAYLSLSIAQSAGARESIDCTSAEG